MSEVKVSTKNQIVIPREARGLLGIKAGSRLLVVVRNGTVILMPKPKDYAKALRGLAKQPYAKNYLEGERNSWR
jgi:AbrB family looped-hinge helix DNA binding protein